MASNNNVYNPSVKSYFTVGKTMQKNFNFKIFFIQNLKCIVKN